MSTAHLMLSIKRSAFVLFQGDSITNAFRKPEEVCNAHQLGSGYAMMVAAQLLVEQPRAGLRFANRGVNGEGIAGLRRRWQADCLDLRPDVLSILVGINDARPTLPTGGSLDDYARLYCELLALTRRALPAVRLVLCEPFVLLAGDVREDRLADVTARGQIVRQLAAEFDAAVVPLQQVFADAVKRAPAGYWSFDGIHPNAQGHWLIAQAWLQAAGKCL